MANEASQTKMVLIVEDEEPIALALVMIVEDAGYTAQTAINGQAALAVIHQHRPDLVVTDLMMPQLTGAELIATLRANGYADLPIVLMSAVGKAQMRDLGADALLPKPFSLDEVDALLAHFLA